MKIEPQLEHTEPARHSSLVARHLPLGTRHSVSVHIEELVLHGFAPGDRHRIAHAVESELARLIGQRGAPAWYQNPPMIERINGGAFQLKVAAKPQATGTEIAEAVFRSLRQHARVSARSPLTRPGRGGRRP